MEQQRLLQTEPLENTSPPDMDVTAEIGNGIGVTVLREEGVPGYQQVGNNVDERRTGPMPGLPPLVGTQREGGSFPIDISLSSGVGANTDGTPGSSCSSITTTTTGMSTGTGIMTGMYRNNRTEPESEPPASFVSNEDKELWYLQTDMKERVNKAVKCNVGKYTKLHVFKYYKFVTNRSQFLKPQPGDAMTPYKIVSRELGWTAGKERALKWNTYAKYSLDVLKQYRSSIVSQMKKGNLQGKVSYECHNILSMKPLIAI